MACRAPARSTLGASGAASGSGAAVNVTLAGRDHHDWRRTLMDLVAQSIGGGGGLFQAFDASGARLGLQRQGRRRGAGGNGGDGQCARLQAAIDHRRALGAAWRRGAVGRAAAAALSAAASSRPSLPAFGSFAGSAGGSGASLGTVIVNAQASVTASGVDASAIYGAIRWTVRGLAAVVAVTLGNATTWNGPTCLGRRRRWQWRSSIAWRRSPMP